MFRFRKQRTAVAQIMRRLYQNKLTTTSGGNVSIRYGDFIIITPSQTDKGEITPKEVGIVTIEGKNLTHKLKPSMELGMHLAIYKTRPDISAIVHAHPVFATTLAASEGLIATNIAGEARAVLGIPAFAEYHTMGTQDLAETVAKKTKTSNIVIMQHHGIVTTGTSLLQAFDRIEVLEAAAKTIAIRKICNITETIHIEKLNIIDEMFHTII